MRAKGVQPVRDEAPKVQPSRRRHAPWIAALAILAAVGGYFLLGRRPDAGDRAVVGPLSEAQLKEALQHAHADGLERFLVADDGVRAWAKQNAGAAKTPYDKAEALMRTIRARASALAFVPWSLGEPRGGAIARSPELTLASLQKDRGRAELYPLEVAALLTAALRTLDVPAQVAELISVDGERAPLDPSGYFGYFAVAVFAGEAGLGTPRVFDPYGGRALGAGARSSVLTDPQTIGAALAIRSLHEASYLADPRKALESTSSAIQLAGTLPSVRTARAMAMIAARQIEQGLAELAAARQLRADAPRLHNLGSVELLTGNVEQATKDLSAALEKSPDFAAAHATLGSLALMRGEDEQARSELQAAERLAPDLSMVAWAQAEQLFRSGDRDQALEVARRALAARPSFDARLRMGVLLRQSARFDELRSVTAELLEMTPAYRQSDVKEMVQQAFGPAALDADAQDVDVQEVDVNEPPPDLPPKLEEPSLRLRG
ncbi:MAG TPA: tetratricopeptide repeat protein, partial [Polyangiales bacterium]|nr:tetratricopeptide repeat protein [Polyangiales bacterium]